jgi:hypothetical protein
MFELPMAPLYRFGRTSRSAGGPIGLGRVACRAVVSKPYERIVGPCENPSLDKISH